MIALDPTHFLGHWAIGIGLNELGEKADAVAAMQRAYELSGGIPFTLGFRAYVCGHSGEHDEARRLLDRAGEIATAGYVPPTTFALGHIGLDEWDAALTWMDRAIDGRDPIIIPIRTFPFLDPLRGDARFGALLHKMRLD